MNEEESKKIVLTFSDILFLKMEAYGLWGKGVERINSMWLANSHFLRTAGPHFPDSPGHIKRTAWDISRAEGTPPH